MFRILSLVFILMFSSSAYALSEAQLKKTYNIQITAIKTYLNKTTTYQADFKQFAPLARDNDTSYGKFYLKRPGKLRWEYNPPMPRIIIMNNNNITHYDLDLDEISYVKGDDSLSNLLARANISFEGDLQIIDFKETSKSYELTLAKRGKSEAGKLTLGFDKKPMHLRSLHVLEEGGDEFIIEFSNIKENIALSTKLFSVSRKIPDYPGSE